MVCHTPVGIYSIPCSSIPSQEYCRSLLTVPSAMVEPTIGHSLQDVMMESQVDITVGRPANEVGHAHPRFAVAVIGSIVQVFTMHPLKNRGMISLNCRHEDWHGRNSPINGASRSSVASKSYRSNWTRSASNCRRNHCPQKSVQYTTSWIQKRTHRSVLLTAWH